MHVQFQDKIFFSHLRKKCALVTNIYFAFNTIYALIYISSLLKVYSVRQYSFQIDRNTNGLAGIIFESFFFHLLLY